MLQKYLFDGIIFTFTFPFITHYNPAAQNIMPVAFAYSIFDIPLTYLGYIEFYSALFFLIILAAAITCLISRKAAAKREKFYQAIGQSPCGIAIMNSKIEFEYVNTIFEQATGFNKEDVIGRKFCQVLKLYNNSDALMKEINQEIVEIVKNKGKWQGEVVARNKNGKLVWNAVKFYAINKQKGAKTHYIWVAEDISEYKKIEKRFKEMLQRYDSLIEYSPDAIFVLNIEGNIVGINPAVNKITGYAMQDLMELNLLKIVVRNYRQRTERVLERVKKGKVQNFYTAIYSRKGNAVELDVIALPVKVDDKVEEIITIAKDITERKRTEEKLKFLSFYDQVTGVYNRSYLEEEIKRLDTSRHLPISVIMGDVNGLKLFNDAFGHDQGDRLLQRVAEILTRSCRKEDVVARWGGDEFVILLPNTDIKAAMKICERIQSRCEEFRDDIIKPCISLGCATKEKSEEKLIDILHRAEDEMYSNKLQESEKLKKSIITSLEKILHENTDESKEHIGRLWKIARKFGDVLNLTEVEMEKLNILVKMHDIGKVGIGMLGLKDDKKFEKHPEIGYRIVQASNELAPVAEAILTHHENWDGTGFPLGLSGIRIPFISRAFAIIKAYEGLTAGRIDGKVHTHEEAIEKLEELAGIKYDPVLVKIFKDMFTQEEHI